MPGATLVSKVAYPMGSKLLDEMKKSLAKHREKVYAFKFPFYMYTFNSLMLLNMD